MMKQLIPPNSGGGVRQSPVPSAYLNASGALTLNLAADKLIGGDKWIVRYEDNPVNPPAIELAATASSDKGGYTVTRSGGSAAKVTIRSLWNAIGHADKFIGRYRVQKIAHGLRLVLADD